MKISELVSALGLQVLQGDYTDGDVKAAYTSDLLSDIMGNAPDECVIITIQAHKNTVAVATLKDSPAIIVCNSRPVPQDMLDTAAAEHIAVFESKENQFTVSGKLYTELA